MQSIIHPTLAVEYARMVAVEEARRARDIHRADAFRTGGDMPRPRRRRRLTLRRPVIRIRPAH